MPVLTLPRLLAANADAADLVHPAAADDSTDQMTEQRAVPPVVNGTNTAADQTTADVQFDATPTGARPLPTIARAHLAAHRRPTG